MRPLFISFFTPGPIYTAEAEGLRSSLEAHGLDFSIERLECRGSWEANTSAKARFVYERLFAYERPIVWIDADARVESHPYLFDWLIMQRVDVAAHRNQGDPMKLLSGTVFFNNTPAALKTAERWADIADDNPQWLDQGCLRLAIEQTAPKFRPLPVQYCFIFDTHRENHPRAKPVILHRQASRRARKKAGA